MCFFFKQNIIGWVGKYICIARQYDYNNYIIVYSLLVILEWTICFGSTLICRVSILILSCGLSRVPVNAKHDCYRLPIIIIIYTTRYACRTWVIIIIMNLIWLLRGGVLKRFRSDGRQWVLTPIFRAIYSEWSAEYFDTRRVLWPSFTSFRLL